MNEPQGNVSNAGRVGALMTVLAWVVVLGLLSLFFSGWMDKLNNPNQQVRTQLSANGVREVGTTSLCCAGLHARVVRSLLAFR